MMKKKLIVHCLFVGNCAQFRQRPVAGDAQLGGDLYVSPFFLITGS
jgi:hypothetical protein